MKRGRIPIHPVRRPIRDPILRATAEREGLIHHARVAKGHTRRAKAEKEDLIHHVKADKVHILPEKADKGPTLPAKVDRDRIHHVKADKVHILLEKDKDPILLVKVDRDLIHHVKADKVHILLEKVDRDRILLVKADKVRILPVKVDRDPILPEKGDKDPILLVKEGRGLIHRALTESVLNIRGLIPQGPKDILNSEEHFLLSLMASLKGPLPKKGRLLLKKWEDLAIEKKRVKEKALALKIFAILKLSENKYRPRALSTPATNKV
jgi:hypothetical protein